MLLLLIYCQLSAVSCRLLLCTLEQVDSTGYHGKFNVDTNVVLVQVLVASISTTSSYM